MRYTARVVPGRGEGWKMGFPTLNLEIPPELDSDSSAEHGVYAGWAWIHEEADEVSERHTERLPAAIHYGPVPVFGVKVPSLEVHVINRQIPETPKQISIEFVKFIRKIKDFQGPGDLSRQIQADVEEALKILQNPEKQA